MKNLPLSGRYLFALAIIGIGLVHFVTGNFPSSLLPVPAMTGRLLLVYLIGFVFCAGGISLFFERVALTGAIIIGTTFLILFLFPHLPKLLSNVTDPGEWTVAAETLALCCGAFIVASVLAVKNHSTIKLNSLLSKALKLAPYVFALSLIVFAVQHYLYAKFISAIVPSSRPLTSAFRRKSATHRIAPGASPHPSSPAPIPRPTTRRSRTDGRPRQRRPRCRR